MSVRIIATAACAAALLSGCTLAEFSSINRTFSIPNEESKLIDVKQRTVLVSKDPNQPAREIVCAEPSPDALTIYAAGVSAQGQNAAGVGAAIAGSVSESGGSIGLRTQSIQLLRDSFYRLCESYLSGAITKEEYIILQRRYQQNMIALLAIEQLTGTVRAPSVVLTSTAGSDAGANVAGIVKIIEDKTKEKEDVQAKKDALGTDSGDGKKTLSDDEKTLSKAYDTQIDALDKDIDKYRKSLDNAKGPTSQASGFGIIESGVQSARAQYTANLDKVANAVESISLAVVNADYAAQLCFSHYKNREGGETYFTTALKSMKATSQQTGTPEAIVTLAGYCAEVFATHVWQQQQKTAQRAELIALLKACATGKDADKNNVNPDICTQLIPTLGKLAAKGHGGGI